MYEHLCVVTTNVLACGLPFSCSYFLLSYRDYFYFSFKKYGASLKCQALLDSGCMYDSKRLFMVPLSWRS